jgi:two-component system, OmpR family, alkaline phosphatase synthesis response regulator PhoP
MNELVLVVDDEPRIVAVAKDYLEQAGYRVMTAGDGKSALQVTRQAKPDLIVLDLKLPELDGLDVCRTVRTFSDVPIIMLTARVEEADRLIGLEIGADDYLTKPFSPRELVARVKVILRRMHGHVLSPGIICMGDLTIDLHGHQVTHRGDSIRLTSSEFALLAILVQHPGQVFSREQLLIHVSGAAYEGLVRSIDAHIKNLRQKIEETPAEPQYILTVFGVGYKCRSL